MPLLGPDDPPPFSSYHDGGAFPLLLLCDHAGKSVPRALERLGVTPAELDRHIGWDIGALDVARELSRRLDAPLVASAYSRLVIDCNRFPGGEGSTPPVSDGTPVPANRNLSKEDVEARAEACFWPYHRAVAAALDRMTAGGRTVGLLVVHSFTPSMGGKARPWEVGVLWRHDPRLPLPLLERLREVRGLTVGDNEPYDAKDAYEYTLTTHSDPRRLPHCSIEVRQDLIATPAAAAAWAALLAPAIESSVRAALS
jgi:predicted N-formylglutamate amidohydrolase